MGWKGVVVVGIRLGVGEVTAGWSSRRAERRPGEAEGAAVGLVAAFLPERLRSWPWPSAVLFRPPLGGADARTALFEAVARPGLLLCGSDQAACRAGEPITGRKRVLGDAVSRGAPAIASAHW